METEAARQRIDALAGAVADEFESTRRILSFDEWFDLLCNEPTTYALLATAITARPGKPAVRIEAVMQDREAA